MIPQHSVSLPPEADTALRDLWRRVSTDTTEVNREKLRTVARQVCAAARRVRLLPVELIVGIKGSWRPFHVVIPATDLRMRGDRVATEMISLCIVEFFAEPRIERNATSVAAAAGPRRPTENSDRRTP
jgi:hypothetical protein